jgi:septin family protein
MFIKDSFTNYYTTNITETLNKQWTEEKIKVILDLISFLLKCGDNSNNVKSLETIMEGIDSNTHKLITEIF